VRKRLIGALIACVLLLAAALVLVHLLGNRGNGTVSGAMELGGPPAVMLEHVPAPGIVQFGAVGKPLILIHTDSAGRFSVSLPPGQYRVNGIDEDGAEGGHPALSCIPEGMPTDVISLRSGQRLVLTLVCGGLQ